MAELDDSYRARVVSYSFISYTMLLLPSALVVAPSSSLPVSTLKRAITLILMLSAMLKCAILTMS
jgi:hypothetical protein